MVVVSAVAVASALVVCWVVAAVGALRSKDRNLAQSPVVVAVVPVVVLVVFARALRQKSR